MAIQMEAHSIADYDAMVAFENEIADILSDDAQLDGHDFGSEETNIFLYTTSPKTNFKKLKARLGQRLEKMKIKIAYRALDSSEYICLFPTATEKFKIK